MKHTFRTERLRVWMIDAPEDSDTAARVMFVAMTDERQVDWHGVAVSACVWPEYGHWVDWVQVSDSVRGLGLGEELLRGIEKHTGWDMTMTGTTESGDKMIDRMFPETKETPQ